MGKKPRRFLNRIFNFLLYFRLIYEWNFKLKPNLRRSEQHHARGVEEIRMKPTWCLSKTFFYGFAVLFLWGHIALADLEPIRSGMVQITSEPIGARISINAVDRGYTPLRISFADGGPYLIEAYSPGYVLWDTTLTGPLRSSSIEIGLRRRTAPLVITSDQREILVAEIKARFVDQDTLYAGILKRGVEDLFYANDVYVGKYQVEISKKGYEALKMDIFVPEEGKRLSVKLPRRIVPEIKSKALAEDNLRQTSAQYRKYGLELLKSAFGIGNYAVESGPEIRLFDERMEVLLKDLDVYLKVLESSLERIGTREPSILRSTAHVYVYKGIILGKYRRFTEAHEHFEKARGLSPSLGREPNPLPDLVYGDSLGAWMNFVNTWHSRIERVDVRVSPLWITHPGLQATPLQFSPVLPTRKPRDPLPASPFDMDMYGNLIVLAEHALRDSIQRGATHFSVYLPKGHYTLNDPKGLVAQVEFRVEEVTTIEIGARVNIWLPSAPAGEVTLRAVGRSGRAGPIIDPGWLTFEREYDLKVQTDDYNDYKQRIVFFLDGYPQPVTPGVLSIKAELGIESSTFKEGDGRFRKKPWLVRVFKRRLVKYVIIPAGAGLIFVALAN